MFVFDLRLHLSRISLAVFVLLLFGGVPLATAQTPEPPVGADAPEEGRWVEVEVPVEEVNKARRAAGRTPLKAKAGGTVTMRYQQPVEREAGFQAKLTSRFAPFVAAPKPNVRPRKATDGSRVISGIDFDENGGLTGTYNIPADPHGDVGGTYTCHVVNVSFECHKKSDEGTVVETDLKSFFGFNTTSDSKIFDPRVVYDPRADRWVVLALHVIDNGNSNDNTSEIFLAVSDGNDPSSTWDRQKFDVKQTITVNGNTTECWFDYPSLALDEESIYVTGNYFGFESETEAGESCDTYLAIFDQGLYSGSSSNRVYLDDPNDGYSTDYDGTLQPAFIFGSTPDSKVGTWVVQYNGLSDGDEFWMVTRVDNPLDDANRSFTNNLVSWGDVDDTGISPLKDAPQKDTTARIEVNDRRLLDLVWRADRLWGTATVAPPAGNTNAGQTTAHYGQIDVSDLSTDPSPVSNGYLGGEDVETGAYTYFPSVAVDGSGNVAFGFSLSASNTYAGAYLVTLPSSGSLSSTKLARDGVDNYYRDFGTGVNRWGDYSGVEIDPSDGSVWTINKVAISEGSCTNGDCGRWGTYLTQFSSSVLPVELVAFNGRRDGQAAVLTWKTTSETNNAGFRVEHQGPERSTWTETAFVEGNGSTTSPQQYRHRIENLDSGVHQFRLTQVDNDGTTTKEGPIDVAIRPEGRYALQEPRPNPTAGDAQLRLSVRNEQTVRVSLYNTLGQKVQTLSHTTVKPSAPLPIQVEGRDLASGVYFVRVEGETFMATQKLTIAQ